MRPAGGCDPSGSMIETLVSVIHFQNGDEVNCSDDPDHILLD